MNPILIRVDPRYPGIWETMKPYLDKALVEGGGDKDWDLHHIYEQTISGRVQLWALVKDNTVFGSAVSTEANYPLRKVVEILLFGADEHTESYWLDCLEQFKPMAKAIGAVSLTGTGRPGWHKKLQASRSRLIFEVDL